MAIFMALETLAQLDTTCCGDSITSQQRSKLGGTVGLFAGSTGLRAPLAPQGKPAQVNCMHRGIGKTSAADSVLQAMAVNLVSSG
jgi:hypothetical protein